MTRRTTRGVFRRKKAPTQWLVNQAAAGSWIGLTGSAVAASTLVTIPLISTGTSTVSIAGDFFVMPQRFTVLRIVGQFMVVNASSTNPCVWSAGIIQADESNLVAQNFDPSLQNTADKSWLWMRQGFLQPNSGANPEVTNLYDLPQGSFIDVRVKRVMHAEQRLNLQFISSQAVNVYPNLRVLISRVA